MTKAEFKTEMRLNRGRLSAKHIDIAMGDIFDNATANFAGYMLTTKKLGVDKAADIVSRLTPTEQNDLITWIETKAGNLPVSAIDTKVALIEVARIKSTTSTGA